MGTRKAPSGATASHTLLALSILIINLQAQSAGVDSAVSNCRESRSSRSQQESAKEDHGLGYHYRKQEISLKTLYRGTPTFVPTAQAEPQSHNLVNEATGPWLDHVPLSGVFADLVTPYGSEVAPPPSRHILEATDRDSSQADERPQLHLSKYDTASQEPESVGITGTLEGALQRSAPATGEDAQLFLEPETKAGPVDLTSRRQKVFAHSSISPAHDMHRRGLNADYIYNNNTYCFTSPNGPCYPCEAGEDDPCVVGTRRVVMGSGAKQPTTDGTLMPIIWEGIDESRISSDGKGGCPHGSWKEADRCVVYGAVRGRKQTTRCEGGHPFIAYRLGLLPGTQRPPCGFPAL